MNFKIVSICLLGFASGLPYMLVYATLGTWLATTDLDITTVGFFAWATFIYGVKFLWSPIIDQYSVPILKNIGNRKSWIILMQVLIILFLLLLSFTNPSENLRLFALFAFMIALFGSIQDIAIDAFRIELADIKDQGNLAASYQLGWRIAILVATTGALILANKTSWSLVYQTMSVLMLVGVLGLFLTPENKNASLRKLTFLNSIWEPFKDIFKRFGLYLSLLLLGIISTYRLTDIITGFITNPFYIEMGYSLNEIALVVKTVALFATIFGLFLGGKLIKSVGIKNSLIIGAILVMMTNLFFAYIPMSERSLILLSIVVGLDSMAAGIVGTVNIAFLTSLVSKKYTAVQYALFTSIMAFIGKTLSGFSGLVVDNLALTYGYDYSWTLFFMGTSFLTIPSIMLIILYKKQYAESY